MGVFVFISTVLLYEKSQTQTYMYKSICRSIQNVIGRCVECEDIGEIGIAAEKQITSHLPFRSERLQMEEPYLKCK